MSHELTAETVNALRQAREDAVRGIAVGLRETSKLVELADRIDQQLKYLPDQTGNKAA